MIKNYTLRIENELLNKFHSLSEYNGRSVNGQLQVYIRKSVERFEKEHGRIPIESLDNKKDI